jgi:hypothetical protein
VEIIDKLIIPEMTGFLFIAGEDLLKIYGSEFKKVVITLKEDWFPRIK